MKARFKKLTALMCALVLVAVFMLTACGKKPDDNPVKYTVTFDGNGGTYVSGELTQSIEKGKAAVAPVFTKEGFTLSWDKSFNNITANTTVKAIWTVSTAQTDAEILAAACVNTLTLSDYKVSLDIVDGPYFNYSAHFDIRGYDSEDMYFSAVVNPDSADKSSEFNIFLYDNNIFYFDDPVTYFKNPLDYTKIQYVNTESGTLALNAAVGCLENLGRIFGIDEYINRSILKEESLNYYFDIGYSDFIRTENIYTYEKLNGPKFSVVISNGTVDKFTIENMYVCEINYSKPTGDKRLPTSGYTDYDPQNALNIVYDDSSDSYAITGVNVPLLGDITIPDTYNGENGVKAVTEIGSYAFENSKGLTSVTIGENIVSIRNTTFYGCTGLKSIAIPDSVTEIGIFAFRNCKGLTSVTMGSNVEYIGGFAFFGCLGLTTVIIPDSITEIGDCAFYGCAKLETIYVGRSSINGGITEIYQDVFEECDSLKAIYVPTDSLSGYQTAWSQYADIIKPY